tara:strand:- start:3205 stop:3987 length:783 start_codon:yes stop_codon:yes gene_type:complete
MSQQLNEALQGTEYTSKYTYNRMGPDHIPIWNASLVIMLSNHIKFGFKSECNKTKKRDAANTVARLALESPELRKIIEKKKYKVQTIKENNYVDFAKKYIADNNIIPHINDLDFLNNRRVTVAVDFEGNQGEMIQIARFNGNNKPEVALFSRYRYNILQYLQKCKRVVYWGGNDLFYLTGVTNIVNMQTLYSENIVGLKSALGEYFGTCAFGKPESDFYSNTNWNANEITQSHINYAAMDAIGTLLLFKRWYDKKKLQAK